MQKQLALPLIVCATEPGDYLAASEAEILSKAWNDPAVLLAHVIPMQSSQAAQEQV